MKKTLLTQASQEDINECQCQTTKISINQSENDDKGLGDHTDRGHAAFMLCGEMPDDSDKHEVVKCELEEISLPKISAETTYCNDERAVEPTCELSDHEILQNQSEGGPALSNKDDLFIVAEEEPDSKKVIMEELLEKKEVVIVDEPLEKRDAPSRGPLVEEKSVTTLKKTTQKAPPGAAKAAENRTSKTKAKSQLNVRQNLRKAPFERTIVPLSKILSKSTAKLEREDTSRARSLKQLPVRTPRPTSSKSRNPKLERPTSSNSRNPKLQVLRPKRKEYFMKLEEKLRAKQAEMSKFQVQTQEEREAAVKLLRKNLNFKATPMPSFYHEAAPRVSEGKLKIATPAKTSEVTKQEYGPWKSNFFEKNHLQFPKHQITTMSLTKYQVLQRVASHQKRERTKLNT